MTTQGPAPSFSEIIKHLDDVCASETFARSPQCKRLLRYLVTVALRNLGPGSFKGTIIGIEVFGLLPSHDPGRQSIVRVTIGTLRVTLARYYETEGRGQPVRLRIPERSYKPEFLYDPSYAALTLDSISAMHVANAKALMNQRTMPSYRKSLRYLNLALERHPEHPRVLALIAMNHAASALFGEYPRSAFEAAQVHCARASQGGRDPWELPVVEAWICMNLEFDWAKADKLFRRAIALNAHEALHHTWYTAYLASQLRWREFLALEEESASGAAYECTYSRGRLAMAQLVTGQLSAAAETLQQTFEIFPRTHYVTVLNLGMLREAMGDYRGAAEVFDTAACGATDTTIALGLRALATGLAGDRDAARRLYDELVILKQSSASFIPAAQLGYACIGVGDLDSAVKWLTIGFTEEYDPMSSWAAILPGARHLRGAPGFIALVKDRLKLKFPDEASNDAVPRRTNDVSRQLTI